MTAATVTTDGGDDATLARAAAAGDQRAFAAIYDRYADRLHDFCIGMLRDREAAADCVQDVFVTAATRLVQLREPDRLRSWLYAIARNEALARIRDRRREQPSEELPDMPSSEAGPAALAARTELADLISAASGGLSDRDRVVLELAYRQGLDGPELADALGVTPRNANTLVERLRDTIARSLGALLVSRRVSADPSRCPELAALLGDWDGELTVLMRKRIARHIDSCTVCEEDRSRLVSPAALLGATPLCIPAPTWLRESTLSKAPVGGAAPVGGESWWPEDDFDVEDLEGPSGSEDSKGSDGSASSQGPPGPARSSSSRARGSVAAGLVALGIVGTVMLNAPAAFRVDPVNSPTSLTTTTTTTTAATTTTLSTTATTTAPPSSAARTAPPETPPPPEPTASFVPVPPPVTETSENREPTTRTTEETTPGPSSFRPPPPDDPEQDQGTEEQGTTVEPAPDTPQPPSTEPPTTKPPTTKPPKPTITKVPPKPIDEGAPTCPSDTGCPPVIY